MSETILAPTSIDLTRCEGAQWLRRMGKPVSPFGARVADFVDWLFDGIYHQQRAMLNADWSNDRWIRLIVSWTDFPTFDNDLLTRLVIGAHDLAIRVSIDAAAPHRLEIYFHPRQREGDRYQRHPTIEDAIEKARTWR